MIAQLNQTFRTCSVQKNYTRSVQRLLVHFQNRVLSSVSGVHPKLSIVNGSRQFSLSSNDFDEQAKIRAAARQKRKAEKARKEAEVAAYLDSIASPKPELPSPGKENVTANKEEKEEESATYQEQWRNKERDELREEARLITLSFWRTCSRCINMIRVANENDEEEFRARENAQFEAKSFSFEPPVDREDELHSRAEYYRQWTLENIVQESDCLNQDPWQEENIQRYLHYTREGEEKRKYILKDYKFEDMFPNSFDHARLGRWEERATVLVHKTYASKGWSLKDELAYAKFEDDDSETLNRT